MPYAETWQLDRTKVDLIKRTICPPETTDDELALYLHECQRRGVHPLDRLVVMTKRNDRHSNLKRVVFMTTINYKRARAEETGAYAGSDDIEYGPTLKGDRGGDAPSWAKATVWKLVGGHRCAFTARVLWREYYPAGGGESTFMWDRMPSNQIGKCAESKALDKAFPQKLGGLPIEEELQRPEEETPGQLEPGDALPALPTSTPPARPATPSRAIADWTTLPAAAQSVFVASEPPADDDQEDEESFTAYSVVTLETGTAATATKDFRKGQALWSLTAADASGQTVTAITADARIASTLQQCHEQQREFALNVDARDTYDAIRTVEPLS